MKRVCVCVSLFILVELPPPPPLGQAGLAHRFGCDVGDLFTDTTLGEGRSGWWFYRMKGV